MFERIWSFLCYTLARAHERKICGKFVTVTVNTVNALGATAGGGKKKFHYRYRGAVTVITRVLPSMYGK